jgi:hypothetical protein
MLYGTPPRTAADGGGSPLVKAVGATGQHRHPPRTATVPTQRRHRLSTPRRRPPQRTAHLLTKSLAALIILGVTGMIGFLILADARRGRSAEASVNPEAAGARLGSRVIDPAPLTLPEVFPDTTTLGPPGSSAPYRLGLTNVDTLCRTATTGALGQVLEDHGCSQVVRASMTTPYGDYQVTAGLFNLADAAGAHEVDDQVRRLVETGDGSFASLGGSLLGGDPTTADGAQVGWHAAGHYLLYSVVSHPGGEVVAGDDQVAARITAELVDNYLTESVLGSRTPIT